MFGLVLPMNVVKVISLGEFGTVSAEDVGDIDLELTNVLYIVCEWASCSCKLLW